MSTLFSKRNCVRCNSNYSCTNNELGLRVVLQNVVN